ncbi:MAG: hypothetical protein ABIO60_13955 [Aquaticitalea sp.]
MEWTFENFKPELDSLEPNVRKKAMEIAHQLKLEKNCSEAEAIKEGISRAEEWFLDIGG